MIFERIRVIRRRIVLMDNTIVDCKPLQDIKYYESMNIFWIKHKMAYKSNCI